MTKCKATDILFSTTSKRSKTSKQANGIGLVGLPHYYPAGSAGESFKGVVRTNEFIGKPLMGWVVEMNKELFVKASVALS
jgi:hypothetical protein